MSLWIALGSLLAFYLAFRFYATYLQQHVLRTDPSRITPAHELEDGIDYVPTNKFVVFGHHFASIAGLGPILGPAIALAWGWLPCLLWVVIGSIFIGAVHDFCALELSLKHRGRSIGDITARVIGPRARILFLLIVFFLLALVLGVFSITVGTLFSRYLAPVDLFDSASSMLTLLLEQQHRAAGQAIMQSLFEAACTPRFHGHPEAILPTFGLMAIAVVMGYSVYRRGVPLRKAAALGLACLAVITFLGMYLPIHWLEDSLAPTLNWSSSTMWVVILMIYAGLASVLPVWLLLQPRDFLNSFLLYLSLGLVYLGLLITRPDMTAPAIHAEYKDFSLLFPFLFITIACGAISGFHNLVSSGTTARQIDSERDSRFVAYGGMLTEGALAVIVILACSAGLGSRTEWLQVYPPEGIGGLGPQLSAVVRGTANLITGVGLPVEFAQLFIAVTIVAFAMTTLDSATRLLRYNVEELARAARLPVLANRYMATLVAVAAGGFFALWKVDGVPAGKVLWALFGTTNQLLACLGLLVVTVYLRKMRLPTVYTLVPMLFMFAVTLTAIVFKIRAFWVSGAMAPLAVGILILLMAIWLTLEGLLSRSELEPETTESPLGARAH